MWLHFRMMVKWELTEEGCNFMENENRFSFGYRGKKEVADLIYETIENIFNREIMLHKKRKEIIKEIHISVNKEAFNIDKEGIYVKTGMPVISARIITDKL